MSSFKINEAYANKYNRWRGLEELQKIADKRKREGIESTDEEEDTEDESSSSEESNEETSPELNTAWYSTLEAIRRRDPKIYNTSERFFPATAEQTTGRPRGSISDSETGEKAARSKPLLLKDYERQILLTMKGNSEEAGDDILDGDGHASAKRVTPGYYETLDSLKQSIKKTVRDHEKASRSAVKREAGSGMDEEDDDEPLLVRKSSPVAPPASGVTSSSANTSSVALKQKPEVEADAVALAVKAEAESADAPKMDVDVSQLDERDRQLLLYDFVINRRYSGKPDASTTASQSQLAAAALGDRAAYAKSVWESTARHASTLQDIERFQNLDAAPGPDADAGEGQDVGLSTDEEELERQEEFEHQYNFRFEEPDAAKIRTYPRKIADSLRRDDHSSTRKRTRERKHERETLVKQKVRQEALHVLRTAASDDDEPDPGAAEKPFSSSSLSAAGQDPRSTEAEPKAKSAKKRAKKPAIEIADVDMPFGYRKVEPLDYGLTAEEILFADEKELNKWVSLKKVTAYQYAIYQFGTPAEEMEDKKRYAAKSMHKFRAFPSLASNFEKLNSPAAAAGTSSDNQSTGSTSLPAADDEESSRPAAPKRKRHKKNKKSPTTSSVSGDRVASPSRITSASTSKETSSITNVSSTKHTAPEQNRHRPELSDGKVQQKQSGNKEQSASSHKRRPRKKRAATATPADRPDLSEARLRAYGIDPRKYRFLPLHKKPVAQQQQQQQTQQLQPKQKQPQSSSAPVKTERRAAGVDGVPRKKVKRESPPTPSTDVA